MSKNEELHPAIRLMKSLYLSAKGGFVELRAIPVEQGHVKRLFVQTPKAIVEFINKYGAKGSGYNVYFGVNKREREDGTKASIERVSALYVDIDTEKNGWDTDAFVKKVHALPGILRPSACVRSGGGLHLYWFVHPDTKPGAAETVNVALRDMLAGDAVQNVDRILRLPGSYNQKRKKKVELEWCFEFERHSCGEVFAAAKLFPMCIGDNGAWIDKAKQAKIDAKRKPVGGDDAFERAYTEGKRDITRDLKRMWVERVRYHAPRGYIGIHEAALIHTARLHCMNPAYPEHTVVRLVMDEIEKVKKRDAPEEHWDMKKEAETVLKMYRSWQPKWRELSAERRRIQAAERKKNGIAGPVRQRR